MTKTPWILFAIAASAVLVPVACGGSSSTSSTSTTSGTTGSGGSGGSSTTTTTTTTTSTTTGTAGGGVGGGTGDCTGILTGDCGTCAEGSCCAELATCNGIDGCIDCLGDNTLCTADNQDAATAVIDCAQTNCMNECFPPPPPPPDATCSVPAGAKGSCVTLNADVTCNPITNEPCTAGQACDVAGAGAFKCYDPPNNQDLCQPCGMTGDDFCKGGQGCIGICAKYCCDDTECGAGTCDKTTFDFGGTVGVCLGGNGAGGAGGGGGTGGAGGAP